MTNLLPKGAKAVPKNKYVILGSGMPVSSESLLMGLA